MVIFEQAFEDQTSGQKKIQRGEYLSEGALPVIDQGQKSIAGYTNDLGNAYQGPLPVILFGDHTLALKYVDVPFALGADGVRVLAAKPPFLSKFLFYYLNSVRIQSRGYSRHFKYLREIRFPHIAEMEQRRVIELLDQADTLRRQRAKADQLADRVLPALFHKMFGDIATNPKRFPTRRLRGLAQKYSDGPFGSNLKSDHYAKSGVRVVRLQNIGVGKFLDDDKAYVTEEHFRDLSKHECKPGDVLIGTMGDPNIRACIQPDFLTVTLNKADCVQFRANPDLCTPEYICWLLNSPSTLMMAGGLIIGQTRARISMGRLADLVVLEPPLPLQERYSRHVKMFNAAQAKIEIASEKLGDLFKAMLHRAFTGELTAKWRAAHLKELLAEMEQQARLLRATSETN
jgi:type I restriction enzyme S subunit